MKEYKSLPKEEQQNFIANFWFLLVTCETQADNENNILLKHNVESMFREWNRIFDVDLKPRWITREERQ